MLEGKVVRWNCLLGFKIWWCLALAAAAAAPTPPNHSHLLIPSSSSAAAAIAGRSRPVVPQFDLVREIIGLHLGLLKY